MAADELDEYQLEKLRAEIQQEKQMKEMLDQSASELRNTVTELEKRYEAIENEGNEWKTRFETQEEINQQLEKQVILLQDKVEEAKRNLKDVISGNDEKARAYVEGRLSSPPADGSETPKSKSTGITINISVSPQAGKSPRDMKGFDDLSDYTKHIERLLNIEGKANPGMVKGMEREKDSLYHQLRDLEWRLDQESKAYHKANDERKQYVLEINTTKGNIDGNKARQRAAVNVQQREVDDISRSPRLLGDSGERYKKKSSRGSGNKDEKDSSEVAASGRASKNSRVSFKLRNEEFLARNFGNSDTSSKSVTSAKSNKSSSTTRTK